MTPDEFDEYLDAAERSADLIDRRNETIDENNWRRVDALLNGTVATFRGFAGLIQQLPFRFNQPRNNERDREQAG